MSRCTNQIQGNYADCTTFETNSSSSQSIKPRITLSKVENVDIVLANNTTT